MLEPLEHETPLMLQLENSQPELAVAVTVCELPANSEQPLGQLGLTDP